MSKEQARLAGEAWQKMHSYVSSYQRDRAVLIADKGLTANDARLLDYLVEGSGCPVGQFAKAHRIDPSAATLLVDRLEKLGLLRREPSEADRRVKLVFLTETGVATKLAIADALAGPPPEIAQLLPRSLRILVRALDKVATGER